MEFYQIYEISYFQYGSKLSYLFAKAKHFLGKNLSIEEVSHEIPRLPSWLFSTYFRTYTMKLVAS